MQKNVYADIPDDMGVTRAAAAFIETVRFSSLPAEAVRVGTRCILDGLGLMVAGSDEEAVKILVEEAAEKGGKGEALLLGCGSTMVPADAAARVLGTAAHAHDWDDSQVSVDPDHIYGLLTHPTTPVLAAALATSQRLRGITGEEFLLGFLAGFEVECKISEWMLPQHYKRGMHSTGTVGAFGAYAAAAKLMGLTGQELRSGFGIVASLSSGIRVNFGTMTKPLHAGRAAENGVVAAHLAARGFSADPDALDGPWGFFAVQGGGVSAGKLPQGFGNTWTIVDPGVSIKPYPCGVLTHPSMDLMLELVKKHDIKPEQIEEVTLYAGSNILNPIRYPVAADHLQAKFSLPAELAMIALNRRAGKMEFSDAFVKSPRMQRMQRIIRTAHDPEIERLGFDKMRSRIEIRLTGGRTVSGTADERYRGGPERPLSDGELEDKVRSCCEGILDHDRQRRLIDAAWRVGELADARELAAVIQSGVNC